MRFVAFDYETLLIAPAHLAPKAVCMTWAEGKECGIYHHTEAHAPMKAWLQDPDVLFIGANVSYDFGVVCAEWPDLIPLVFEAYENDRVVCVQMRQKMLDIAAGCYRGRFDTDGVTWLKHGYSLFDLTRRLTGRILKKDGWRLRYSEFRDVPLSGWIAQAMKMQDEARRVLASGEPSPHDRKDLEAILLDPPQQCIEYPLDDARTTLDCFMKQEGAAKEYLRSQFHEARAAFALHLSSCWGMRTNAEGVEELRVLTEAAIVDVKARLVAAGLVRADGSRDTKKAAAAMEAVCKRDGLKLRLTKGGGTSLDEEACLATEDPLLLDYAKFTGLNKTLTADYVMLLKGTVYPVHPRYDMAETSRTTCSGPNLQNVSKK